MAFSLSQRRKFTERNIGFGERGASRRRKELSDYANILQELRNQGLLNVAESGQEFERPEQEARIARIGEETEGLDIANIGQRFFQGLAREFGPSFMRQNLGMAEPKSRASFTRERKPLAAAAAVSADAIRHDDVPLPPPGLSPKSDISAPSQRFQIGPVPWALNLRKRREEKERAARIGY